MSITGQGSPGLTRGMISPVHCLSYKLQFSRNLFHPMTRQGHSSNKWLLRCAILLINVLRSFLNLSNFVTPRPGKHLRFSYDCFSVLKKKTIWWVPRLCSCRHEVYKCARRHDIEEKWATGKQENHKPNPQTLKEDKPEKKTKSGRGGNGGHRKPNDHEDPDANTWGPAQKGEGRLCRDNYRCCKCRKNPGAIPTTPPVPYVRQDVSRC